MVSVISFWLKFVPSSVKLVTLYFRPIFLPILFPLTFMKDSSFPSISSAGVTEFTNSGTKNIFSQRGLSSFLIFVTVNLTEKLSSKTVKVFDKDGRFLRKLGNKGQGPGEYQYPGFLMISPEENILIFDVQTSQLSEYSPDGEFVGSIRVPVYFPFFMDSARNIYAKYLPLKKTGKMTQIVHWC